MAKRGEGTNWADMERFLVPGVSVLQGRDRGAYPSGNSLLVRGSAETILIDPSVTVVEMGGAPCSVDAVVNSHSHEDHLAGNGVFADSRIHIHKEDLPGAVSMDGLLGVYGLTGQVAEEFSQQIYEEFHYTPRPDASGFSDGNVFDLGDVSVEAVHLPGHTRGHSGFRVSNGVFFLSDIDLTGFGPYYGDVWSDLDDFERSLEKVRDEDAQFYVTFHQKGVIEGRGLFLEMLDKFTSVIHKRHAAMLEYLTEPHSLEDMVAHRFVYRPGQDSTFGPSVERRTAELHVQRMLARGEASEVDVGRYQTL